MDFAEIRRWLTFLGNFTDRFNTSIINEWNLNIMKGILRIQDILLMFFDFGNSSENKYFNKSTSR